ncbi:MAG: acyl-CoA thioester hydrolase [Actinomycetota bacterium]|nr:acyl-CoA thioester hydrolase [Actinomycetota bacterium]
MSTPYVHTVRVRYGECDMQRIVFNANYMAYCDDAMECWFQAVGMRALDHGWDFMLKRAVIEWQSSATVAEVIDIGVEVARWGTTSFDVSFVGTVGERPVFTMLITYVGVELGTSETMPPPAEVKAALSA